MFKALFKKLIQLLTNTKDEITVKQNLSQGKNNTQIGVQVNHIYVISESDRSHIADKVKEVHNGQHSTAGYTWFSEDKKYHFRSMKADIVNSQVFSSWNQEHLFQ